MALTPTKPFPLRIIVVEDLQDSRDMLCLLLTKLGYSLVGQAASGQEALAVMEKLGDDGADVLIMDVGLPEGKHAGIEIAREVFERWLVPCILCTALSDSDESSKWAEEWHILYYMQKPASTTDIAFALAAARRDTAMRKLYATLNAATAYISERTDSTRWDAHERLYNGAKREQMNVFEFAKQTLETLQNTYRKLGYDYK